MPCVLGGLSTLSGGNINYYQSYVRSWDFLSYSFPVLSPYSVVSSHVHADQDLAKDSRGPFCRSPEYFPISPSFCLSLALSLSHSLTPISLVFRSANSSWLGLPKLQTLLSAQLRKIVRLCLGPMQPILNVWKLSFYISSADNVLVVKCKSSFSYSHETEEVVVIDFIYF